MSAVEFEQVLSLDDIKNVFYASFRQSGLYLLWVILLITTAAAVLLSMIVVNEDLGVLAIGIGIGIYHIPVALVKRRLKRRKEIVDRTSHFTIDEQGVTIRESDIFVCVKWNAFARVEETPKYLFLFLKNANTSFCIHKLTIGEKNLDALMSLLADAPVEKRLLSLPAHSST